MKKSFSEEEILDILKSLEVSMTHIKRIRPSDTEPNKNDLVGDNLNREDEAPFNDG